MVRHTRGTSHTPDSPSQWSMTGTGMRNEMMGFHDAAAMGETFEDELILPASPTSQAYWDDQGQ